MTFTLYMTGEGAGFYIFTNIEYVFLFLVIPAISAIVSTVASVTV